MSKALDHHLKTAQALFDAADTTRATADEYLAENLTSRVLALHAVGRSVLRKEYGNRPPPKGFAWLDVPRLDLRVMVKSETHVDVSGWRVHNRVLTFSDRDFATHIRNMVSYVKQAQRRLDDAEDGLTAMRLRHAKERTSMENLRSIRALEYQNTMGSCARTMGFKKP